MIQIRSILLFLLVFFALQACQKSHEHTDLYSCPMKCEGEKTYDKPGTCPVCKMQLELVSEQEEPELAEELIDPGSIFNLESKWVTQNEDTIQLSSLKGKPTVAVMIYTTCQAACPRLVADMRNIKTQVNNPNVQYLLVSIDPENDTPARFREFMKEQELQGDQWILLQGQLDDVRELSNVLAVRYKRISPMDFAHTNILSVIDENGNLIFQQEGLGVENTQIKAEINQLLQD